MSEKWNRIISGIFMVLFLCVFVSSPMKGLAEEQDNLKVSYIYVGQGDGALLESNGKYMMIDSGTVPAGPSVTKYLKEQGVKKLDYVISTHPHSDHAGGFLDVFENFEVGTMYKTPTTYFNNTYMKLLSLIAKKGIHTVTPQVGTSFQFGSAKVTFLAPNSGNYEQLNDMSIVVKIENGDNSFLFTGDAETISEIEMLNKGFDLKADVLKVGHHSALTSTSKDFLAAVDPSISVISLGKNNKSGFPRLTTLAKLKYTNIYRTDTCGTIEMESDGKEIYVKQQPYKYASARPETKEMYNLYDLEAVDSEENIYLQGLDEEEDYDTEYTEPFYIDFSAEYGISAKSKIEYMMLSPEQFYADNKKNWKTLPGSALEIKKPFTGCVYVKFTNNLGNSIVRRTNGFVMNTK